MGLDANVMCNCFRNGKTTTPPFPREWLEVDDEGYLNLRAEHNSDDNWGKLCEWEQSCCEHEGMDFVCEHISNWTGYRQFQAALSEIGWQHFPILKEQLPEANGGLTSSAASAQALLELEVFGSYRRIGKKTVLVDTASGEGLHEYVAAYEGVFILSGSRGINVGLTDRHFFAVDRTTGSELFHATRFRQYNQSSEKVSGDRDDLVWEDLDTGSIYKSGIAIHGKQIPWEDGSWQKPDGRCRFEYPSEFHVEQRERFVTDFDHIVRALKIVFEASVTTRNPVRWC